MEGLAAPEVRDVVERAKAQLGYDYQLASERPLAKVLSKLGIEPFTEQSVAQYKKDLTLDPRARIVATCAFATCVMATMVLVALLALFPHTPSNVGCTVVAFSALCISAIAAMTTDINPFTWRAVNIDRYSSPIPLHVLSKALEIKNACAELRINVEFGVDQRMSIADMRVLDDPFLIVSRAREMYYIEVWDEPKFEAAHT